jgi:hypothetical protein
MVEKKTACRVLVGKPTTKRLLVRSRCTWEDSISTDLKVTE